MSLYNINGKEVDTITEAVALCREIWHNSKAEAVLAQHREALSKPSQVDRERAAVGGVSVDMSRVQNAGQASS